MLQSSIADRSQNGGSATPLQSSMIVVVTPGLVVCANVELEVICDEKVVDICEVTDDDDASVLGDVVEV